MKKVTLVINRSVDHLGYYLVVVSGEGFSDSNDKSVSAQIRGEDPVFDDRLFSIGFLDKVTGGTFSLSKLVLGSQLNEDWGEDEIYALVRVEGLAGTFRTNTVIGNY